MGGDVRGLIGSDSPDASKGPDPLGIFSGRTRLAPRGRAMARGGRTRPQRKYTPPRRTHRLQVGGKTPRLSRNVRGGSIKRLEHGGVVKLNCKIYNGDKTSCLENGCHWNFSNDICN